MLEFFDSLFFCNQSLSRFNDFDKTPEMSSEQCFENVRSPKVAVQKMSHRKQNLKGKLKSLLTTVNLKECQSGMLV